MLRRSVSRYLLSLLALPLVWVVVAFPIGTWLDSSGPSDGVLALECGRRLTDEPNGGVSLLPSVRVVLAWDEEWTAREPATADTDARHLLLDAASMFRSLGIHLLPVRTAEWKSPDDAGSVRRLIESAQRTIPRGDADIVVVISGQAPATSEDGFAEVGGRYVIVTHHPERPQHDAHVLAHEIGHLFGAHHGCDVPGYEGLMAERGFDDADLICPCTRRVLELNSARFHEAVP